MTSNNNSQAANDLLNGGGGPPAFKFDNVGDTAKGRITNLATSQVTDFKTGEPKFYNDGNPIMQIVITVQPDDGEEFRIFVKPKAKIAIREAVQAAGADGLEAGGMIALQFSGNEAPSQAGLSPTKLFTAQYKAPVAAIPSGDLL
jgi:Ca2+-binding RTX toxin-like protein